MNASKEACGAPQTPEGIAASDGARRAPEGTAASGRAPVLPAEPLKGPQPQAGPSAPVQHLCASGEKPAGVADGNMAAEEGGRVTRDACHPRPTRGRPPPSNLARGGGGFARAGAALR